MVGTGDVEPQPCHSCNVIGGSLGFEVELWASEFLAKESIWVLIENAREGERLNDGAKALKVEAIVDSCPPNSLLAF